MLNPCSLSALKHSSLPQGISRSSSGDGLSEDGALKAIKSCSFPYYGPAGTLFFFSAHAKHEGLCETHSTAPGFIVEI